MKVGTKVWFWEVRCAQGGSDKILWRNLREGTLITVDGGYYYIQVCGEPNSIYELYRDEFWTVSEKTRKDITELLMASEKHI